MTRDIQDRTSYSVKEVASMTGVQPLTIYRNLDSIPHVYLGSRVLIKASYVKQLSGETA